MDKRLVESVKMLPIGSITPYKYNTKLHTSTQVRKIANSIGTYGWDQPIVVDGDMVIVKGHGRLEAAKLLGLSEIPVLINHDISYEEAQLARIADNKVAESEWDLDELWTEITDIKDSGIDLNTLGFDSKQIDRMFGDRIGDSSAFLGKEGKDGDGTKAGSGNKPGKKQKPVPPEAKMDANGRNLDPTVPLEEGFIGYHKGEDAWLRKLSMVDYLNYHDKIVVGFSSGKDSMAALIWVLEHCDRDKVFAFYTNPGWGVDWPHSLAFVKVMEKQFNIKIQMAGPSDPECIGGFIDNLVQMGYPGFGAGCWIESHVKIPRANALLRQNELIGKESGKNVVQIMAIRWEESPNRAKIYPDRGYFKDTGNHYGNPVLQWTGADIAAYLEKRNVILHTAYEGEGRMGCLMCPKGSIQGAITIRKKFPEHWRRVLEFYSIGVRRGSKVPEHFRKWIMDIDSPKVKKDKFSAEFSSLALSTRKLEALIEEMTGEELPTHPYLNRRFDPAIHKVKDDLRGVIFRQGRPEEGEYPACGTDDD